ncbi:MAG: hypothetical protein WA354_24640 [Terracidiphilus sp.]
MAIVMTEQSNSVDLRLQRLVELRWLREVVVRQLAQGGTLDDTHSRLEGVFAQIQAELDALEGTVVGGELDQPAN